MIDTELEDILTVLAIGVYADKRIFASEIQVFTQSVSGIELSKRENSKVSGAQALLWFEMHKDEIREKFDGPRSEFDAWIIPILHRVSEHGNRPSRYHFFGRRRVSHQRKGLYCARQESLGTKQSV